MDRTQRRIACEVLDSVNVEQAHLTHRLHRAANVYKDGLTDKEFKYLMSRHKAVEGEMQMLTKLIDRLRHR